MSNQRVSVSISTLLAILVAVLLRPFRQPWDAQLATQVIPISHRMGSYIRGRTLVSLALSIVVAVGR